ncbi:pyridoxine/pyridoxamine 5'-phosphate oxidase [Brachybacterium sp. DNPG3]
MPADPRELVAAWLDEAIASGARQGHAMTLTTIAEDGAPVGRTLILKDVTEEGYCFSTHASSRKGRQLAADPRASMLFFWRESGRQVRITGEVVALDDATAQRDWEERPTYDGRPNPDWRVYALRPTEIEVMQAREDRRHVRIEYRLVDGGDSGSEGGGAGARWTHGPVATPAG